MRERDQAAWLIFIAAYSAGGLGFFGLMDSDHPPPATDDRMFECFATFIGFSLYLLAWVARYARRYDYLLAPDLGRPPTQAVYRMRENQEAALPAATAIHTGRWVGIPADFDGFRRMSR